MRIYIIVASAIWSLQAGAQQNPEVPSKPGFQPPPYVPASSALHDTIARLDSLYFDAYNNCNLERMRMLMSDDIEFYHDSGGLTTSIGEILEGIKKNVCGKVTRILAKGSLQVHSIPNYGAVEIGYHSFYNKTEPDAKSKDSMFIVIWQYNQGKWEMARVVSLH